MIVTAVVAFLLVVIMQHLSHMLDKHTMQSGVLQFVEGLFVR